MPRQQGWRKATKVAADRVVGAVGLVVLAPVMAIIAILLRVTLGSPVLFRQQRAGFGGALFTVYKFRTMTDARDGFGVLLPDGERQTRIGRFLRSTSLDELPQLLNVVRGDLSLVGPRPLLPRYLPRYSPRQARRHEVLPGVTGWAQINGRNSISWDDRLELDVWYVEHWSLMLDLRILGKTLGTVLRRHGISEEGNATMSEFTGSSDGGAR